MGQALLIIADVHPLIWVSGWHNVSFTLEGLESLLNMSVKKLT